MKKIICFLMAALLCLPVCFRRLPIWAARS